ncbi:MAG TPA: hypothetical protein VFQ69_12625 [Rhizomicrobium sp.]|nr:hypothetical protein [Rhizomicrobium sp.]
MSSILTIGTIRLFAMRRGSQAGSNPLLKRDMASNRSSLSA